MAASFCLQLGTCRLELYNFNRHKGAKSLKQETARESSPDEPDCRVSRKPFSEIPHQSRLFVQYQTDPLSLKKFYPNVLASPAEVTSFIPTVLANYRTDRDQLCDTLTAINSAVGAGGLTFENIERLREPDAVAVITGQQAGLFSGPMYTIYKALSTVKLAATLNQSGTKAVPVFWAATEDHDFAEVAEAFFIDKTGGMVGSKYDGADRIDGSPVGSVGINGKMADLIESLFDELPHTKFTDDIRQILNDCWSEGMKFGEAFGRTLMSVLRKFGIVYIDPMHDEIKQLSAPIYAAAIDHIDEIVSSVVDRGKELVDEGFHAQVLVEPDYFPLFWHDDERRRLALRKARDGVFRVKDGQRAFSTAELRQIAVNEPQRFSPGVMLRPVVQDHLFPTACYFGGGAEIAYFAQNSEVYRILDRPVTPVFHRQSFTVVEAKQRRVLKKFGLDLIGLFEGKEETILKIAGGSVSPGTVQLFADVEERINSEMNHLDQAVSKIETTLLANLTKRRRRIMYHIAALRKKTLLAKVRNDEIVSRQINEIFATLLPHGELQERTVNVFSFLNKYGLNFVDWVYDAIDLDDKDHRIIEF